MAVLAVSCLVLGEDKREEKKMERRMKKKKKKQTSIKRKSVTSVQNSNGDKKTHMSAIAKTRKAYSSSKKVSTEEPKKRGVCSKSQVFPQRTSH